MAPDLLHILRCPETGQPLRLDAAVYSDGRVRAGWLATAGGERRYPIRDFIPRFVEDSNYAVNFGFQWNRFPRTQLDSYSGLPISANRFWKTIGLQAEELAGKWVLDVGCGAGRFAEVALQAGAIVVALDYSNAIDACYANLKHHPKLHVVQGDVYALPLATDFFHVVYSLGMLQHTPRVREAFDAMPSMLRSGGLLCVDVYPKRLTALLHPKYLLRPVLSRMSRETLFAVVQSAVPVLLPVSRFLGRIPGIGRMLKRAVPVADYSGVYGLSASQLRDWALLDTYDMLAPRYDNPQTSEAIRTWFERAGATDIEVFEFRGGHLVGRGRKSQ